ncbi:hypothetical protein HA402_006071 [Bradysia odoriphaga]|nr:hypothetical protein HA402_006071 [Bradysia odoriphaga]
MNTSEKSIAPAETPSSATTTVRQVTGNTSGGDSFEQQYLTMEEELQSVRESESRLKQQYAESQRRERILVRRLAVKEQEIQDYAIQITELKAAQAPGPTALRNSLLDPAVNILFQKLKDELQATRARLEETQNELSAWKFTPDSNTGKRLMAKCRLLYQENEELGKMTSNGRLAKLEGDLALQKSFSEEVKKSQSELDDFLQELDEDVEGMQSTILFLQQELKASKDTIATLEQENNALKNDGAVLPPKNNGFNAEPTDSSNGVSSNDTDTQPSSTAAKPSTNQSSTSTSPPAVISNCSVVLRTTELRTSEIKLTSDRTLRKEKFNVSSKEPRTLRSTSRNMVVDEFRTKKLKLTNGSSDDLNNGGGATTGMVVVGDSGDSEQRDDNLENNNFRKRSYESDSSECSNKERTNSKTNVANKKSRRSSVLSLDLNDEDSRIEIDEDRTIFGNIGTKLSHVDQPV